MFERLPEELFDPVRKKWVKKTPEEYIRQQVINALHQNYGYPYSRMSIEKQIQFFALKKRFDIVIYDKSIQPFILVECKSATKKIDAEVILQISRYNYILKVPYLLITNGKMSIVFKRYDDDKSWLRVEDIPHFQNLDPREGY